MTVTLELLNITRDVYHGQKKESQLSVPGKKESRNRTLKVRQSCLEDNIGGKDIQL